MAKTGLTDAKIAGMKPPSKGQVEVADAIVPGLRVRIGKSGKPAFLVRKRHEGRIISRTLGVYDPPRFGLAVARQKARDLIEAIDGGDIPDPVRHAPTPTKLDAPSFREISEQFLDRHVTRKGLRTAASIRRQFEAYIWPAFGHLDFIEVRRRQVIELLDAIEDGKAGEERKLGGPVMADRVLATLSKMFNWYATRDEEFVSPIVRGMKRTSPSERARARILSDDEIRALWGVADSQKQYGAFLKLCLLTGQRRGKVEAMTHADIGEDGYWTIPDEDRAKGTGGKLLLPRMVLEIIEAEPIVDDLPWVFPGRGDAHFHPGSKAKTRFDLAMEKVLGEPSPKWVVHDLRRTSRSIMARAGVRPDIAERVVGHAIAGVEGVYDRHTYDKEKAEALRLLSDHVQSIVGGEQ